MEMSAKEAATVIEPAVNNGKPEKIKHDTTRFLLGIPAVSIVAVLQILSSNAFEFCIDGLVIRICDNYS
jgi:hypothetical protein